MDVAGGSETAVGVTLTAVVHTAHLVVLAEADATVLVDQGTASKGGYDGRVASGVHTVQVTAAGNSLHTRPRLT